MEFGICNLGNVPLRSEPNDRSETVSFVVFGEHFKINQFKEKWIEITTFHDNIRDGFALNSIKKSHMKITTIYR